MKINKCECGGEGKVFYVNRLNKPFAMVACIDCRKTTELWDVKDLAIREWNRASSAPELEITDEQRNEVLNSYAINVECNNCPLRKECGIAVDEDEHLGCHAFLRRVFGLEG